GHCPIASQVASGCGVFSGLLSSGVAGLRCGDGLPTVITTAAVASPLLNPPPCDIGIINPNLYVPYVISWQASLQKQVGRNITVNMVYVGNHGDGIRQQLDINQAAPGIRNTTTCPAGGSTPDAPWAAGGPATQPNKVYCANNEQARRP